MRLTITIRFKISNNSSTIWFDSKWKNAIRTALAIVLANVVTLSMRWCYCSKKSWGSKEESMHTSTMIYTFGLRLSVIPSTAISGLPTPSDLFIRFCCRSAPLSHSYLCAVSVSNFHRVCWKVLDFSSWKFPDLESPGKSLWSWKVLEQYPWKSCIFLVHRFKWKTSSNVQYSTQFVLTIAYLKFIWILNTEQLASTFCFMLNFLQQTTLWIFKWIPFFLYI